MADIPNAEGIGQQNDCGLIRTCRMLHLKPTELISQLLPNTQVLQKLRYLSVGSMSQAALEEVFTNCRQLESLLLCDTMGTGTTYDIRSIGLCQMLKVLLMPLNVGTPLAVCSLVNLTHLTLQRHKLSQGMEWMPTVLAIIHTKRFDLQGLTFDGSGLAAPMNLSHLQLAQCTALTDLRLSNCYLAETDSPPVPFSCQRLSFRRCIIGKSFGYMHPLLRKLDLFNCQILFETPMLRRLLNLRRHQPIEGPLLLTFSQSLRLRSELTKWSQEDVSASSRWLQVKEVDPHQATTWHQPCRTLSMKFGRAVSYIPDLNLPEESIPSAADVLSSLDSL
uniref:AT18116p n=1 Tax=Drosophila melanogaster TaxID=7227 RepID=Q8T8X8_DROME|nr:AT18116p [Drosophila melanogaster]